LLHFGCAAAAGVFVATYRGHGTVPVLGFPGAGADCFTALQVWLLLLLLCIRTISQRFDWSGLSYPTLA
jgi:hypothetical protein